MAIIRSPNYGTQTNDDAAAGFKGELIFNTTLTPLSLSNGAETTFNSVSLTPGDWDVWFAANFTGNAATVVPFVIASISLTNNALLGTSPFTRANKVFGSGATPFAQNDPTVNVGPARFSLAATTTIYGVVYASFTVNTCSVYGSLRARRVR